MFFSFLLVKPAEKVQIGTSKDEVSLGFRTLKLFIVECLCCLLSHWQSNLISLL